MPYQISPPETKEFTLDRTDAAHGVSPEEATKVTIRMATVRQNSQRGQLFAEFIHERARSREERDRYVMRLAPYDLVAEEVFLTMVGCNISMNSKPLFKFNNGPSGPYLDMTKDDFNKAWGLLTDEVAAEIHEKVIAVNPHWTIGAVPEDDTPGE